MPGCPEIAAVGGYCQRHAKERPRAPDTRDSASRRGYDQGWRRLRAAFLRRYSECADCGAPATEAHHLVSVSEGGSDSWDNLIPLCKACHSRRTRQGRGVGIAEPRRM